MRGNNLFRKEQRTINSYGSRCTRDTNKTQESLVMATEQLSPQVGRGLPEDDIEDIGEFIKDAVPNIRYRSNPDMDVIYEILEKDGWDEKVSAIANRWVSVRKSVHFLRIARSQVSLG